jgi:hypothetical protein
MIPRLNSNPRLLLAILLVASITTVGITEGPGWGVQEHSGEPKLPGTLVPSGPGPQIQLGAAGGVIGFSGSDGSGTQTITLVDTRKSWMAVYHIDMSGKIRLVSSRPIDADFSLQLNATSPLPEEIRALQGR